MASNRTYNFKAMLAENRKRIAWLIDNDTYDPVTGKGSPIPRFKLKLDHEHIIWLPETMKQEPIMEEILKFNTFREYVINQENQETEKLTFEQSNSKFLYAVYALQMLRCRYDFEYWAYTCCKIVDKESSMLIPFRLRQTQRIILQALEEERAKGTPVYLQIVKARQFGGSTLIQLWMMWIQTILHENWDSCIVTDKEDQARRVMRMYKIAASHYPQEMGTITLGNFEGSNKNRLVKERGCVISIASMESPDSLRSSNNHLVHCSEVGLWKKTEGKAPEDMVQTLNGSLAKTKDAAFILESTAKGVGNFFHKTWTDNTLFRKVFIPWFQIDMYVINLDNKKEFIDTWDDEEWALWEMGATIQGINWRRRELAAFGGDKWRFGSEYPATPEEAFSTTGDKFYSRFLLEQHKKFACEPKYKGNVYGRASEKKEAFMDLRFEGNPLAEDKCLFAWSLPDADDKIANRYIVTVDIGGESERADYSTINVIDRMGLLEGGGLERAATWRGHIDQTSLAWKAAQIAEFYGHALLVIECNSLDKEENEGTEGPHFLTVIDAISPYYDNIYKRRRSERSKNQRTNLYGFHMNKQNKQAVMDIKKRYMENFMYLEYDERALHEAALMERRENGVIANVVGKGNHDDIEVPTATAIYVSENHMEMPKKRTPYQAPVNTRGSLMASI